MKTDLLIGGLFIVLAALGLGGVAVYASLTEIAGGPQTVPPQTEPIAEFKKKPAELARPEPVKIVVVTKKLELKKPEEAPKVVAKKELGPLPVPKTEAKIEPKKEKGPEAPPAKKPLATKTIVLGNVTKLNDPDGEYAVKSMSAGQEITLLGKIKKLTIGSVNERSILDATRLDAEEIVVTGDINGSSKVLLGRARLLRIRSINDQSLLDASELEGQQVFLSGAVNGRSTLKVHAPKGSVEIDGEINDNAQIDIVAPGGKVVFKSGGDFVINGDAQLKIVAESLELRGTVHGLKTLILLTLTKPGVLQWKHLSGGVRLHYRRADASDPAPRIERGQVDARAEVRELPAERK